MSGWRHERSAAADQFAQMQHAHRKAIESRDQWVAIADAYRAALERIVALWTNPAPAQRQDVAFQQAVRIASEALQHSEPLANGAPSPCASTPLEQEAAS